MENFLNVIGVFSSYIYGTFLALVCLVVVAQAVRFRHRPVRAIRKKVLQAEVKPTASLEIKIIRQGIEYLANTATPTVATTITDAAEQAEYKKKSEVSQ